MAPGHNPFTMNRKATIRGMDQDKSNTRGNSSRRLLEDPETKALIERRIKKTKNYCSHTKKFINLSDSKGKTALHYAAFKGNVQLVQMLLSKYKALTLVRDHKGRVSL